MAGAATTGAMQLLSPGDVFSKALIKNAEIINEGDLVGLDTNGYVVVASKTQGAIVKPLGLAFFEDNNGTGQQRTGDGSTIYCSIARKGRLYNANSTLVPGLAKGAPVYLGPVPTSTVSNYTCTATTTNGDALVQVGYVFPNGLGLHINMQEGTDLKYQTAGNSTVGNNA